MHRPAVAALFRQVWYTAARNRRQCVIPKDRRIGRNRLEAPVWGRFRSACRVRAARGRAGARQLGRAFPAAHGRSHPRNPGRGSARAACRHLHESLAGSGSR